MIDIDKSKLIDKNKEILTKYQIYLFTERHMADNSIDSYILDIIKYLEYVNKDYNSIIKEDIYKYLAKLDKDKLSVTSVERKIVSIKSFHKYLGRFHNIKDIAVNIEHPKFYRKLPNTLTIEEVELLLDIKLETPFDYRNKAMLELMYATGLRVSELCSLELKDVDLEDVKNSIQQKIDDLKLELEDLDKEKVLQIAKEKGNQLKEKSIELYNVAVEKGTPVLQKAAAEIKEKTIQVVEEVLKKLKETEKTSEKSKENK